ncbi:TetR/AcrR family transcriptional regulator [Spirilliplanes yamanashiensis]|uniref:TetR family transcriptional regulator n=1 Tax=Spirilliplanes yamanashiensis TaxID=42233 RepID=A0A8J4DJ47_9ACTN|nr:TetR/AcrR family transcriptional regulator [Spirilliplanes yamanashiensis]MDP9815538.1 AcrR family transcriptional regulator [Spirilliplanes yamanashiensis]GIJ03792.1 TetR family transcriptional regulator [Spirilliplanes yamanashiensis]
MARLNRAEQQALTRARVLAAAQDEFTELGFRDAKVDRIAERADLTRGAVYSNFPSKLGLFLAVLVDRPGEPPQGPPGETPAAALGAFARAWIGRLPLSQESRTPAGLRGLVLAEALADDRLRQAFAQAMQLDAVLLGLALEEVGLSATRQVRAAEQALTVLHGAGQLAAAAPGFADPWDMVGVCRALAAHPGDTWDPPHLPFVPPATAADAPWEPPAAHDAVTGEPSDLGRDGVVAVLGAHRLGAAEEAVRAARPGDAVTVAVVSGDPGELGRLVRFAVDDLMACVRAAFPRRAWPRLAVVLDDAGAVAAAAGVPAGDGTQTAVRVAGGRVVARADGYGAAHAAASA